MDKLFDDISRILASSMPRRQAMKFIAGALVSATMANLGLGRAWAADPCPGEEPCEVNGIKRCCPLDTCCTTGGIPHCCDPPLCCGVDCVKSGEECCIVNTITSLCPLGTCCRNGTVPGCCDPSLCCRRGCCTGGDVCCNGECVTPCQGDADCPGDDRCNTSTGCCEPPTAIELLSFTAASGTDGRVTLTWKTATEINNAGFAIYRSDAKEGQYTKIGFLNGAGDSETPHDYQFRDKQVEVGKTYFYYLEDIDLAGNKTKSDIIKVTVGSSTPKGKLPTTWANIKRLRK